MDGVLALTHGSGMGAEGQGLVFLQRALAGYAGNPNSAGILLLDLGCEVNQTASLMENMDMKAGTMCRFMNIQEAGGTAILSETPEIYGAEHLLTRRAVSQEVGQKLVDRIRWWEEHTRRLGGEINNNPAPGNKAGGLTTILEKSLGASVKGGTTNLMEVYEYAQQVSAKGLVFMDTPGYDPASITGMVAGGANLICFTTGRGTV